MNTETRQLLRALLLITVILAVPILPFVIFGDQLEARFAGWLDESLPPATGASIVVGLLAADIFLPVPSSIVSTFSGRMLGFWGGTGASWLGMTIGAGLAFWLVRFWGRPLAKRLAGEDELARIDGLAARYGVLVLVLARPVPVFAEASVLLMASTQLAWWRFLLAVGLSNLGIAAAYALIGERVQLPIAIAAAMAFPLFATALAKWLWPAAPQPRAHE